MLLGSTSEGETAMDDDAGLASIAADEIAAAEDYWRQLFERYARDPMATLVAREKVLDGAEDRAKILLAQRGVAPEEADVLATEFAAELANAPLTSPGVDPHFEIIFGGLCDRVEGAIAKVSKAPIRVARGIEPRVGVFAARMGVMMTDASVITIGSQVFRFCNVVGKALATTIMLDPQMWDSPDALDAKRALLRGHPAVVRYWTDILISFALTGSSLGVPVISVRKEVAELKDSIVDAMEIFAVAHEYSHHLQRHGRLLEASVSDGPDRRARGEEFEADSIAIMIGQLVTGFKPAENLVMISGAGMVVMLSALDLLAKAKQIFGKRDHLDDGSHPSAADRFDMINRQEHLWGNGAEPLRRYRETYIEMMKIIGEEVLPVVEMFAGTEEFKDISMRLRALFDAS
jgi:hypothetical protein